MPPDTVPLSGTVACTFTVSGMIEPTTNAPATASVTDEELTSVEVRDYALADAQVQDF